MFSAATLGLAQISSGDAIGGFKTHGLLKLHRGCGSLALFQQGHAEVQMRPRIPRLEPGNCSKFGFGFVYPARQAQLPAQRIMRLRVIGVELDRLPELLDGFLPTVQQRQRQALLVSVIRVTRQVAGPG